MMSQSISEERFLRLSGLSNSTDYLRQAVRFLDEVDNDPMMWKWVVIALHGALYGFAICACKGTNPERVTLKPKKEKASKKQNRPRLITFDQALERCQDPNVMGLYCDSKPLVLDTNQEKAMDMLKQVLRNEFEHFIPKVWSIELLGMPAIAYHVLIVIRFLALDTGNVTYCDQQDRREVELLVEQGKKVLSGTSLWKEFEAIGEDPTACL